MTNSTSQYTVNSVGWVAEQLNLELAEAISLIKQAHKSLPMTADANTPVPQEKVNNLLASKQGRDNVLKLNGEAPQQTAPGEAPKGGAIAAERRLLTLAEIKTVAAMSGTTQKLVKSLDHACFQREEELRVLLGFKREERLVEAENAGRLAYRLNHSDRLNSELDDLELELANSSSRTTELVQQVFGINLQQVIDNQAEADFDRAEARSDMTKNFEAVQSGRADSLGEDALIDPWATAKHDLSELEAKRFSRLRKAVTS